MRPERKNFTTWTGTLQLVRQTLKAYQFWDGTGTIQEKAQWVPKSQVYNLIEMRNGACEVTMAEWIAKEKGFL